MPWQRLHWRGGSVRRLSHCALNPAALTNTISIQAASQRGWEPGAPCRAGSNPRTGRERNQGTGMPSTISALNLRELQEEGKHHLKSFSKPTPWCSLGMVVSPCSELFSINTAWGTTAAQKVREALNGMRGNETISISGLQHSSFKYQ